MRVASGGHICFEKIKKFAIRKFELRLQYVALGPRVKVVISNILPASTRNELKFSLKVAFMCLASGKFQTVMFSS